MNFFTGFFEKRAKKNAPRRYSAVHSKVLKKSKKIGLIVSDYSHGWRGNPPGAGKTTAEPKHAAGLTPRDYPVRWVLVSRATS